MKNVVSSDENIARIIRNEWISDGELSADDILHEVRWALYDIAELQKCKL